MLLKILGIATAVFLLAILGDILRGKPTRRICIKEALASIVRIATLVWAMFFLVTVAAFFPALIEYVDLLTTQHNFPTDVVWAVQGIPPFVVVTALIIAFVAVAADFRWQPWKLTPEEKAVVRAEREKWEESHPTLARIFSGRIGGH